MRILWGIRVNVGHHSAMKPHTMTPGDIIVNAVIRASALAGVEIDDDGVIFIWEANAPEQIEAALAEAGWELVRIRR